MTPSIFNLPEELILELGKYLYGKSLLAFAITSKHVQRIIAPLLEDEKNEVVRVWDRTEEGVPFLKTVRVSHDKLPKFWSKYSELRLACEEENITKVQTLLKDKRVLHVLNDEKLPNVHEGMYGLLEAAGGSIEIINLLKDTEAELEYLNVIRFAYLAAAGKLDKDRFREQLLLLTGKDSILDLKEEATLWNALYYALLFRAPPPAIDLLISSGLSFNNLDIEGFGPLECAFGIVQHDNYETEQTELEYLRWLLSKPELQGPVDASGRSAVHYAALMNHLAGLKLLLTELKAGVDAPDRHGITPLLAAIEHEVSSRGPEATWEPGCKIETIEILLGAGASVARVLQVGGRDITPLDLALTMEHPCLRLIVDAWLSEAGYQTNPNGLLVAAAHLGDLELMETLWPLCDTPDEGLHRYDPEVAIIHAARKKHSNCVAFLLGHLPRLYAVYRTPDLGGVTALEFALSCSDLTDVDIRKLVYATPSVAITARTLLEAVRNRSSSIVTLVYKAMHPPHREEALRHKALVLAAELGKRGACRALLKRMDFAKVSHRTALQAAVNASIPPCSRRSRLPVFKLLMEHNLELLDPKTVNRAALSAAHLGHSDVLKHIIDTQGDVICESHAKILEVSACLGYFDIIDTLYSQRPELKARDMPSSPSCLLLHAAAADQRNLVRHLIRTHNADLNHFDARGRTALHYAAAACLPKMVKLLLRLGSAVSCLDCESSTPFFLAATARSHQFDPIDKRVSLFREHLVRRQLRTMRILLDNGAKIDAAILSHCVADGEKELVQFLVDKKVDILAKNVDGTTPLEWAKSDEIIKLLYSYHV
jgi:ankyrin repeat protein